MWKVLAVKEEQPAQYKKLSNEVWTIEKIVDELTTALSLYEIEIINEAGEKTISRKYQSRAFNLIYKISVYRPSPPFVINLSDIPPILG